MRAASENIKIILAENLRKLRRCHNLSQDDLAVKCGLHRTYISSIEQCERNVTLSTLEILATALGVLTPDLITERASLETDKKI